MLVKGKIEIIHYLRLAIHQFLIAETEHQVREAVANIEGLGHVMRLEVEHAK